MPGKLAILRIQHGGFKPWIAYNGSIISPVLIPAVSLHDNSRKSVAQTSRGIS